VPVGTLGNQNNYTGPLGMDFDVLSDITITQLGVFYNESGTCIGPQAPLQARLYQRDDLPDDQCPFKLLATLDFTIDDPGTPIDASLFKPLPTPITLPAGFTGCIVASGYGALEPDGNLGVANHGFWSTDDGGGLIAFVGKARYGANNHPDWFPLTI